ncbi:MAG: hypothetical protein IJ153_11480 [Clostridia bacterium]|nr:hypothetical protein [Clostridia bacterium]MBQ9212308.1 hypothetical protein [Clostridia bacterium]
MRGERTVYLVKKGNEYLQAITGSEGETDVTKMQQRFSIYLYDAAQIPKARIAKQIVMALIQDGDEPWTIVKFDKLSYYAQEVARCV